VNVVWAEAARDDLKSIRAYIAHDNPRAATRLAARIRSMAESLARFPEQGRTGKANGTRELAVAGTPYVIVYANESGLLGILRVIDGAQLWPPEREG